MPKIKTATKLLKTTSGIFIMLVIAFIVYSRIKTTKHTSTVIKKEFSIATSSNETLRDSVVNFGLNYLGTPYAVAGATENGFDCSGFAYFVFKNYGIEVPRSSAAYENFGVEIPIEKVLKGDILLFLSPTRNVIGHLGIVTKAAGKESDFIYSSSGREMQVMVTSLSNKGYTERFVKAIRVIE